MRADDLKDKKVVIWGLGNEGKAVAAHVRKFLPAQPLLFIDEAAGPDSVEGLPNGSRIIRGAANIEAPLKEADIVIKSPGVSLYHPLIQQMKKKGTPVVSLLNLWLGEPHTARVICVTGTKGKSTTSSLLVHALKALGKKAEVGGNIGVPVAELDGERLDFAVIEVSSYQAADIEGMCEIAVLTSLFPEHLDWHGSKETYYADKLNLLGHAKVRIVNFDTLETVARRSDPESLIAFNQPDRIHAKNGKIYDGNQLIGELKNAHLSRAHNLSNVCAVLTVIKFLELDIAAALQAMESFRGLPHRQQELGEKKGVLYVNDSIATTPQAALAALRVYDDRPVTLIAGGFDRGVDYAPLTNYILAAKTHAVICLGPSGKRIYDVLEQNAVPHIYIAMSMKEAVEIAQKETPKGGVILLSPAAPSYGLFHNFMERGRSFATESGFKMDAV